MPDIKLLIDFLDWDRILLIFFIITAFILDCYLTKDKNELLERRYYPLKFLCPVLMIYVILVFIMGKYIFISSMIIALHFIMIALLIWLSVLNWKYFGLCLFNIGWILNCLVMALNGGKMPVVSWGREELIHKPLTSSTILPILADRISVHNSYLDYRLVSIGDILLVIGAIIFLIHQLCRFALFFTNKRRTKINQIYSK